MAYEVEGAYAKDGCKYFEHALANQSVNVLCIISIKTRI